MQIFQRLTADDYVMKIRAESFVKLVKIRPGFNCVWYNETYYFNHKYNIIRPLKFVIIFMIRKFDIT